MAQFVSKPVLLILCGGLMLNAHQVSAVSNLSDRLDQPAVSYGEIEQSLFIDITNVAGRLVAVGARGSIIFSDDNGATWSMSSVPVSSLLTAVYFPDDTHGWAVGHGGIVLHSKDKGKTWHKQFDGNRANKMTLEYLQAQYAQLEADFQQADEYDQEDIQYAMEDMEFALEDATIDAETGPSKPLLDVWFKNAQEGYVIGAYGFFFHTLDGGETWSYASDRLENFDRYHLNAMTALKGGALLIVGEAGQMFASYDDGETWETLYGPYQGSFFGLQATAEDEGVLAYGLRGNIYKSDDAGGSWRQLEVPVETTLTASAYSQDGHLIVVGFSGVVLSSVDHGESFSETAKNGFEAYNGVVVDAQNKLVVVGDKGIKTINE